MTLPEMNYKMKLLKKEIESLKSKLKDKKNYKLKYTLSNKLTELETYKYLQKDLITNLKV